MFLLGNDDEGESRFMTTSLAGQKRKRSPSTNIQPTPQAKHPYLSGNFAPIQQTLPLTPCTYTGRIPEELAEGEYVRNGSNPVSNDDLGRDSHWFDGDGMLSGVSFAKDDQTGEIRPEFVNQFVLTDLYLNTLSSDRLRVPILPSIATLVSPVASFLWVTLRIMRTILLVILSHLPGSQQKIKKISVANTNVIYHDGRALATCESGPPMRIQLPGLETVGWYNGVSAEGEPVDEAERKVKEKVLGEDGGLISFMREWTTAHPKVDPVSKEMLLYHASFAPPYVQYSVIPQTSTTGTGSGTKLLNVGIPKVSGAKMMHDFGVSSGHTVIMDLPLTLDPINQLKGLPTVHYDSSKPSRFGVFPRHQAELIQWFETDGCCIFHTANSWDALDAAGNISSVNMLACRLTSATLIYAAGNMAPPPFKPLASASAEDKRMPFFSKYDTGSSHTNFNPASPMDEKEPLLRIGERYTSIYEDERDPLAEDQCRLYYYSFDVRHGSIAHQWALSAVPFEFPSVHPQKEMQEARYVYGCSTTTTDFGAALGKATKIDAVVKIDAKRLIERGQAQPPKSVTGVVDLRTMAQVLETGDASDPIQVFRMPAGWFAQEPRFVPSSTAVDEDDGYLLFYAFDETQLDVNGNVPADDCERKAKSELWIVNAKNMSEVIGRVQLPQRVPYGLHGSWFSAEQIHGQREVESIRSTVKALEQKQTGVWMTMRDKIEHWLG
ncbi:Putative carotenoid oxygenase [Septoria linicola]|uniref:Carotenoid oxygenase n=1 Tax=Septoria linicola TaxID=215465 RepID=A0A9Q9APS0_9PEZI|nr:putative carotenoid oxygenase [Septoria linicola]USW50888.1 Putative carotenoid oxygenase [Septoria linicola]